MGEVRYLYTLLKEKSRRIETGQEFSIPGWWH